MGYECVMIPGATKAAAPVPNSICGNGLGLVTAMANTAATTICSEHKNISAIKFENTMPTKIRIVVNNSTFNR